MENGINVKNAWYLQASPTETVVELENGTLRKFRITPFRKLAEKDLTAYKGHHPASCRGKEFLSALYRRYGLEKGGAGNWQRNGR